MKKKKKKKGVPEAQEFVGAPASPPSEMAPQQPAVEVEDIPSFSMVDDG